MQNENNSILLLSIRRPYSQLILLGKKKFELRKRVPRSKCEYAFIYETSPTKAVVGYFKISRIILDKRSSIWKLIGNKAGINKKEFDDYYKNKSFAVAIEVEECIRFETPMPLSQLGINHVPQDFVYVKSNSNLEQLIRV